MHILQPTCGNLFVYRETASLWMAKLAPPSAMKHLGPFRSNSHTLTDFKTLSIWPVKSIFKYREGNFSKEMGGRWKTSGVKTPGWEILRSQNLLTIRSELTPSRLATFSFLLLILRTHYLLLVRFFPDLQQDRT